MSGRELDRIAPFKSRGQNFLIDTGIARRLVTALELADGDRVLEVGPGTGALTVHLVESGTPVTAVEVDRGLAAHVEERFESSPNFTLVQGDFTRVDPEDLRVEGPVKFISNLPYNITTPILLRLVDWPDPFDRIVVMVQKEVADRIRAKAGSRTYGRLSVAMALFGRVEFMFKVPPGAFRPRPRVLSGTLRVTPHVPRILPHPYKGSDLERLVRVAFSTRRKQLAKNLAGGLGLERSHVAGVLESVGLKATCRAEDVDPFLYPRILDALGPLPVPGVSDAEGTPVPDPGGHDEGATGSGDDGVATETR